MLALIVATAALKAARAAFFASGVVALARAASRTARAEAIVVTEVAIAL